MKDFYYILGVARTASTDEIKTAYRKLSLKFHPDKNGGDKFFEDRFKDINEAYEVLSDSDSRLVYNYQFDAFTNRNGQTAHQKEEPRQTNQQKKEPKANNGAQSEGAGHSTHRQTDQASGPSPKADPNQPTNEKTAETSKRTIQEYASVGFAVAILIGTIVYIVSQSKKPMSAPATVYTPPSPTYYVPPSTQDTQPVSIPQNTYQDNSYQDKPASTWGDYFSIGSTKSDVMRVQGTPTAVNKSDFIDEWSYGLSSIEFENGRVKSYHNISGNLRVRLKASKDVEREDRKNPADYFTLGSTKEHVLRVQGTPSGITKSDFIDEWSYGLSSIEFEEGVVRCYHNISGNLIVIMRPDQAKVYSGAGTFSIGSTKDEVLAAQGTPTGVERSMFIDEWSYGLSSIDFEHGRVKSYHNISSNLRVSMSGNNGDY